MVAKFERKPQMWSGSYAVSTDGRAVAAVNWPQAVVLLDGQTLEPVGTPLVGQRGSVMDLTFDPSGKLLATASEGHIVVWDVEAQQALGQCFAGPPAHFGIWGRDSWPRAWFAPNGRTVATVPSSGANVALCPVGVPLGSLSGSTRR